MSANETIKAESRLLRGTLAAALAAPDTHFDANDEQLLKFHGSYQQEDRDARRERRAAGLEKAYQFMVRSRIPRGALTAEQYLVHDDLAERYGNGTVRLTTRQGIQLHGVLKGNLRRTIHAINERLLTTLAACGDVNRNVMACPAPPRSPAEAEVHALADALARHLTPRTRAYHELWIDGEQYSSESQEHEPIYGRTYLPRKFKIGFALPHDNCTDVYTQDIGFIAEIEGDVLRGFTVIAGGGLGSTHGKSETYPRLASPLCFVAAHDVLTVAEAIVTIQRDYGDRENRKHARMKYLIEERGTAWFRAELEARLGRRLEDPRPVRFDATRDHLGWHDTADGTWFLGIHVQNGRLADWLDALTRRAVRTVLETFALSVRITPQQNLLLCDIRSEDRAAIERIFGEHGVEIDPEALGLARGSMACPALPTCGLAVAESERALPALLETIAGHARELGIRDDLLPSIRMTGCPNGCARPRIGDIGIVGRSLGVYELLLGGDAAGTRFNQQYAPSVRESEIGNVLRDVFAIWVRDGNPDERLGDFVNRIGIDELRRQIDRVAAPA